MLKGPEELESSERQLAGVKTAWAEEFDSKDSPQKGIFDLTSVEAVGVQWLGRAFRQIERQGKKVVQRSERREREAKQRARRPDPTGLYRIVKEYCLSETLKI